MTSFNRLAVFNDTKDISSCRPQIPKLLDFCLVIHILPQVFVVFLLYSNFYCMLETGTKGKLVEFRSCGRRIRESKAHEN